MTGRTDELTYAAALAELRDRGRYGIRLGLGRIRALLREIGDPQLAFRGALVAGTNGKGSVLALAGAALREAGHRVGETPKPHLVTYRERLQVNGRPIDPDSFARLIAAVLPAADRVAGRHGPATEFELLTAAVFRWFAEESIDLALVEVGLGGRLDATHAWDGGVAVVTNVDLDHTAQLGPTVLAIAREKAAIIERGDLAVTGATGDGLGVIRRRAARMGAPLTVAPPAPIRAIDRRGLLVELPNLGETRVGLRGRHQAANVAVADATLDALETAGIATVPPDARRAGYAAARWPGRLELLDVAVGATRRSVLLDGAHNPAGAAALAVAIDDHVAATFGTDLPGPPLTILTAAMADKDVDGIIAALGTARSVAAARVIATRVEGGRALDPAALAERWRSIAPVAVAIAEPDTDRAIERALADAEGLIVVTGSLYLVGAVRARLVDDPALEDPRP